MSSLGFDRKTLTRKRTLEDYHETVTKRDIAAERAGADDWLGARDEDGWTPGSPQPFVNTKYQLAGGMDTPGLVQQHAADLGSEYVDAGYRRSLGDVGRNGFGNSRGWREQDSMSYFPAIQDDMGHESDARGRYSDRSPDQRGEGWSKAAIQVVGGVVGKVWEFCKTSGAVFRGFQAGNGVGYKVNMEPSITFEAVPENESSFWHEKGKMSNIYDRESTPLPGRFPEDDFLPNYMDHPSPEYSPPQPAKRRQVSRNTTDELARNWVVVPETQVTTPSKPQPRAPSRFSMPTASSASRRVVANTSSYRPASRPASRAGFNRQRSGLQTTSSRFSQAGSPALNSTSRASFASPRSPGALSGSKIPRAATPSGSPVRNSFGGSVASGAGSLKTESPAAKEAKKWAAVKRKEEREQDESIRRLDAQLKAMIREAKEALGTKIEVEIDDDLELRSG